MYTRTVLLASGAPVVSSTVAASAWTGNDSHSNDLRRETADDPLDGGVGRQSQFVEKVHHAPVVPWVVRTHASAGELDRGRPRWWP